MRAVRSAEGSLLPPPAPAPRTRARLRAAEPEKPDATAIVPELHPSAVGVAEGAARSSPAARPRHGTAPVSTPHASRHSAPQLAPLSGTPHRSTPDEDLFSFLQADAPTRTPSALSLALSGDEGGDGDAEEDEDDPWAAQTRTARVSLPSPRSAPRPIAVAQPPVSSSMPRAGGGKHAGFDDFYRRARAANNAGADAAAPSMSGPTRWRGTAEEDDAEGDAAENPSQQSGSSFLSQSLPPLRALALRDCILRRTGFIESPDASPPVAAGALLSPPQVAATAGAGAVSRFLAAPAQPLE